MKIILQIFGATIQVIGAIGIVFISLPSILALIFHGRKTSLFSIGFIIIGILISVIFMFLGYIITKNTREQIITHAQKQISDVFTILAILGVAGILAAMFIPTGHHVGPSTYRMLCKYNHMSQVGLALRMYATTNQKRYLISSLDTRGYYPEESGDKGLKKLQISGFLENNKIYKCPKDRPVKKTFWEKTFGSSSKLEDSEFKSDFIYLGGFHSEENPAVPILFDKIGNHKNYCNVIFSDGESKPYKLEYTTYEDLIEVINKEKNYSKENLKRIKDSLKKAFKNNKTDSEKAKK